jgi:two-component system, chemotaxis family, chemotaxis protein CheY
MQSGLLVRRRAPISSRRQNRFAWASLEPSKRVRIASTTGGASTGGEAAAPERAAPIGENERPVFIVDDDGDSQFLLQRQLVRIGVATSIVTISNGQQAIERLKTCLLGRQPFPSIMFLDIKMPVMNGFEVLQWMGERQLLGYICVVVLSSCDDAKDVSRAMALGAHACLTKPAPIAALTELITATVRLGARKAPSKTVVPRRVLVVDDSSFARRTTRRLFEVLGYDVIEAQDGPTAIERFQECAPDLVFLDLVMEGEMTGFDVLSRLRTLSNQAKIIIATADTQDSTAKRVVAAGAVALVNKPLNIEKVAAILRQI